MNTRYLQSIVLTLTLFTSLLVLTLAGTDVRVGAQGTFPDPNAGCPPATCGQVSPFIPMQSAEAVHMGLVWKRNSSTPKILFHARFPEYTPNDVADPALVDLAIARGAFTTPGLQFNSSLRDVLHGFDPFLGLGTNRTADDSFQRLTYGGYLMRQGLSQSVPTRIVANRTMERQLLFDISHPDAFKTAGKFHTALLDENDFAMNRAAFAENGYSKGMFYNTYCNARVTLADGRVYVFGGHDMQSDNGLYKVNVFDPETESWIPRREPCTRSNWKTDPFGAQLFAQNPNAQFYPNCDPRNQQSTQPSEPSDQKYSRWYPSAIPLPNDMILVVGGFDQDNTVPPDPNRVEKGRLNIPQGDTAFTASRVNQVVAEVYDPRTDRNIALENARMAFPLYPQLEVVQTGPRKDDWVVCTFDGERDYGAESIPGGARFGVGGGTPDFTKGTTWCLDVLAALKDPNRNVPAKNHWTLIDTASEVRPYCCPTASLIEIDGDGDTVSHKWFMISGHDASGEQTGTVEVIDFTDRHPRWELVGNILQPLATTKAVLLPDGKVLIGQGINRSPNCNVDGRPCTYEEKEGLHFQMFDPVSGSITKLAKTTVSRGLHGTATLLPDGSVFFAGENREALVRPDDPSFPLLSSYAGLLPRGDPDQGVPVGQLFFPPYLFKPDGTRAVRPEIKKAPEEISYGGHFDITVGGNPNQISSVVILRSDHNTHSLTTGDRYVKLAYHQKGAANKGELRIRAPKLPAQAVPGIYMLFVLDQKGVPSHASRLYLVNK
ncbi:MAG TPA: galactose oxidase-like domain-containing protein [Pyrinomonadaceae bacterium]|nr:galactose oxidase-like domain-containing protein [Pyrinomonadaceae bacterium]